VENHIEKKGLSRHLVWTLALVVGACGSGGGGSNGGNGGTSSTGHGGSSAGGSGGSGAGGTQGSGGSSAGVAGSSAGGSGGSAGSGAAGTSGGSGGSAGSGAAGTNGGSGGSAGSGGAAGRGGQGGSGGSAGANGGNGAGGRGGAGGTAGANGGNGAGGRGGAGGTAGASGGEGGRGGTGGSGTDGGSSDAVVQDGATMSGGAYVRTAWTATYTCTGTCPAQDSADTVDADTKRAFDGTLATRWSTGQYQQSTALMSKFPLYFTVDMHETVNITRIVMDPGNQDHFDAPGQMDVLVSFDGTTYTTAVSAHKPMTPSNGQPDTIMLPAGTVARYIQLKATMTIKQVSPSLGDRFWAIGEMNVYGN
jgi:hypothetical protein